MELNEEYSVKYIGNNKDILENKIDILSITIIENKDYIPPKHFWSRRKSKKVYDIKYTWRTKDINFWPFVHQGILSEREGLNYFDTFEDAVKFVEDNFIKREPKDWRNTVLSFGKNSGLFKPILSSDSGNVLLLEDVFAHNVYVATRQNNEISSIAPYYDSYGRILKANKFNPAKFSIHNYGGPYRVKV